MSKICEAAAVAIRESLDPETVLKELVDQKALTLSDVCAITSHTLQTEQADELLDILRTKPSTAYATFMGLLHDHRPDLFQKVREIEKQEGYVRSSEYTLNIVIKKLGLQPLLIIYHWVYHIVKDHACWVESIVMYHQI